MTRGIPRKVVVLFRRRTLDHSSAFRRQWFFTQIFSLDMNHPDFGELLLSFPFLVEQQCEETVSKLHLSESAVPCGMQVKWFHWLRLSLPCSPKTFMVTRPVESPFYEKVIRQLSQASFTCRQHLL